jgi:DNA-binding transcriptional LysR family regulator
MVLTDNLNDLYLLTRVIEAGGFAAAARQTGMTRSLLSRRVVGLEQRLGAQLLLRNARHFAVTPLGEEVYRHALLMCESAEAALHAAQDVVGNPAGRVRVDVPDLAGDLLSQALVAVSAQHERLQLSLSTNGGIDALLAQRIDLALHMDERVPDRSDIVAHRLCHVRMVTVGSPRLLRRLGSPTHPDQLEDRHCLGHSGAAGMRPWVLRGTRPRKPAAPLSTGHLSTLLVAAREGAGVAQLPLYACAEDLKVNRLQRVFEGFDPEPVPVHLLSLSGLALTTATRGVVQSLRKQLALARLPGVTTGEH